jgi:hypothetical protein
MDTEKLVEDKTTNCQERNMCRPPSLPPFLTETTPEGKGKRAKTQCSASAIVSILACREGREGRRK